MWEHSSAGRASALQAEGHRFEPYCSHHTARQFSWLERRPVTAEVESSSLFRVAIFVFINASVAQSVEQGTENPRVDGSIPSGSTTKTNRCLVSAIVLTQHLCGFSSSGRAPPCQGGGSEFEPRNPLHIKSVRAIVLAFSFFINTNWCTRIYSYRQSAALPSVEKFLTKWRVRAS